MEPMAAVDHTTMSQRPPERHFNCPRPFAGRDQGEETALTLSPVAGEEGMPDQQN